MRRFLLAPLFAVAALAQPAPADPLDAVANALGGADRIDAIETVRIESQTRATLGASRSEVQSLFDLEFPGTARWTVRLAGASQVTWVDGPDGVTVAGHSTRALSEAAKTQAEGALWLHPLVLAARRSEVSVELLADDLLRVAIPGRKESLLVGLNEAGRPSRITTFRRREGRRDYVEVVFRDYREVDGVFVPHRIQQAVRGVVTGEQTVQAVRFGIDLTGEPFESGAD